MTLLLAGADSRAGLSAAKKAGKRWLGDGRCPVGWFACEHTNVFTRNRVAPELLVLGILASAGLLAQSLKADKPQLR
jgi:hypothetical protein